MTDGSLAPPVFRVIVLAPNWLGDTIMATPLLELLHRHASLKDGRPLEVHLAVRPGWEPLFREDRRISSLLPVQRDGRHSGTLGGIRLGRDLATLEPDGVLLGPPSLRAGVAALFSGADLRVGYATDRRSWLLNPALRLPPRGSLHHGLELRALGEAMLESLGESVSTPNEGLPAAFLPGCESVAAAHDPSGGSWWVLAPGATYGSAKSWPLEPAAGFAAAALSVPGRRLLLLGDAAAGDFARDLAEKLGTTAARNLHHDGALVDLTGRTDLLEVVALLKGCEAFVGNDSGLMHLAAGLGVPTVGIFGSSNPHWTRPLGARTRVVAPTGFDCRPCYLKTCNQARFCLETVSAEAVHAAVLSLLEGE